LVDLLLHAREANAVIQARADRAIVAVKTEQVDTVAELKFERNARMLREQVDRREMQNMQSEHNGVMLQEALRVRREEAKAGEHALELAVKMSDLDASRVRFEEQQRIYQEATASSDEQRDALREAQRKVLDLRKEQMDLKKEAAETGRMREACAGLERRVKELEAAPVVTLTLGISAVDHIALADAAREARKAATREAEVRFAHETRALQRRCNEQEENIERQGALYTGPPPFFRA